MLRHHLTHLAVVIGSHAQTSYVGDFVLGGSGVILALAILRLATNVGRITQMLDDHDKRLGRLERAQDAQMNRNAEA